jgi:hypothetical protein
VATLTGDRYPSIDFTEIFYRITQTNASMRKAYQSAEPAYRTGAQNP